MHLRDKMAHANDLISQVIQEYRRPAMMWSGGKDSMVLLFMLRARNIHLPIIFHQEPWFPRKYSFAREIIEQWNLTVYDWPPIRVTCQKQNGVFEIVNHYQVHAGGSIILPKNLYDPAPTKVSVPAVPEPWLCGLEMVRRPVGTFDYPWDVVFHGHKTSDVDPLLGPVKLLADLVPNHLGPALAFPMRHWTDEDVWDYSRSYQVPQQPDRYNRETGEESSSKMTNPDYWAACTRCMDPDSPKAVWCPKLRREIGNVSHQMPLTGVKDHTYIEGKD